MVPFPRQAAALNHRPKPVARFLCPATGCDSLDSLNFQQIQSPHRAEQGVQLTSGLSDFHRDSAFLLPPPSVQEWLPRVTCALLVEVEEDLEVKRRTMELL